MTCMVIAEVTSKLLFRIELHKRVYLNSVQILTRLFIVFGIMGLKKSAVGAALMLPLLGITLLFNGYVRRLHFHTAEFLPTRDSFKQDLRNGADFDLSFLTDAYKQDELKTRVKVPILSPSQIAFLNQNGVETDFGVNDLDLEGDHLGVPNTVAPGINTIDESARSVLSENSRSPKKRM
jgi:hypothetical protein